MGGAFVEEGIFVVFSVDGFFLIWGRLGITLPNWGFVFVVNFSQPLKFEGCGRSQLVIFGRGLGYIFFIF